MNDVYRAPLRSRRDDIDHAAAVEWALEHGVVGVGGVLDPAPGSLVEAVERLAETYDERLAARLDRFAAVPGGSFVWTRHPDGNLWVGRLTGSWTYDDSAEAAAVDLPHVRSCHWPQDPVPLSAVPEGVLATFDRGGRNFQRTHDAEAAEQTRRLWGDFG